MPTYPGKDSRSEDENELFYECHYNRNVGRVKTIENDEITVNVNAGHGGGEIRLPRSCCIGFYAEIDDRVLLCVGPEGQPALKKLKKTR